MTALITGASSGIGRDMARILARKGISLILVARRTGPMEELKKEFSVPTEIISCDLSDKNNIYALYEQVKDRNIDILINNAGFGVFGRFCDTDLERETEMIATNVTAPHMLMKLFLRDMKKRDSGYILNVASIAGFFSGPLMATYYATKNYVVSLTGAIREELKQRNSHVHISAFCPGPVATEFNEVANVKFSTGPISSKTAAHKALGGVLKGKPVIVPSLKIKSLKFIKRLLPDTLITQMCYHFQKKKQ